MRDLVEGIVFPAIRKNEVHFYYGGARLCMFKGRQMYTNNRYRGLRDGLSRDGRIPVEWSTPEKYEELKKNCANYRRPERELVIVSKLFSAFPIAAPDGHRLLDIECRFPGGAASPGNTEKKQNMIDCLFLTRKGTMVFVEVKTSANNEAKSSGNGGSAAVVEQLGRYQEKLKLKSEEIRSVYVGVIETLSDILKATLPTSPQTVFGNVPLLFVGPTSPHSPGAKEVWQRDLLARPLSLSGEIIAIDGRDGRMVGALNEFFGILDSAKIANQ